MGYISAVLLAGAIGLALTLLAVVALVRSRKRAARIAWSLAVMLLAVMTLVSPFALAGAQSAIGRAALPHRPAPVSAAANLYVNSPASVNGANITALRAVDGSRRWQRQSSDPAQIAFTVVDGVLYLPSRPLPVAAPSPAATAALPAPAAVSALRASDGLLLWTTAIAGSTEVGAQPGTSTVRVGRISAPPVVADGNVYVGLDFREFAPDAGLIVALRASDGHELWRRQVDNFDSSETDQPLAAGDGRVFVAGLGALHASDGSLAWRGLTAGLPVYAGGVVYIAPSFGSEMQLTAVRASDGKPLWTSDDLRGPANAPRAVHGFDVVLGTGMVFVGLVTVENGTQAYLAGLNVTNGKQRWLTPLPGWPEGTAAAQGVAFVGFAGGLEALDTHTGALRWRQSTGSFITYHHPQVIDAVVFAGSTNDRPGVFCFADCGEPNLLNALSTHDGSFYWRQPLDWAGSPLVVG